MSRWLEADAWQLEVGTITATTHAARYPPWPSCAPAPSPPTENEQMKGLLRAIDAEISKMAIPSVDPHDLPPLLSIDSQGSLSSLIAGRSWKILEDQGLDFVLPSKVLAPPPPWQHPVDQSLQSSLPIGAWALQRGQNCHWTLRTQRGRERDDPSPCGVSGGSRQWEGVNRGQGLLSPQPRLSTVGNPRGPPRRHLCLVFMLHTAVPYMLNATTLLLSPRSVLAYSGIPGSNLTYLCCTHRKSLGRLWTDLRRHWSTTCGPCLRAGSQYP